MTRTQQTATRRLQEAQEEYLIAYGWHHDGKFWTHRKLKPPELQHTTRDALEVTRAEPTLGWP